MVYKLNNKLFGFFIISFLSFNFIASNVISNKIYKNNTEVFVNNICFIENNILPPNPPNIEGPSYCKIWGEYHYNFTITHKEDIRLISLYVSFGDGTNITKNYKGTSCLKGWPFGYMISISHKWIKSGNFSIKAKVKDYIGTWSEWGELEIYVAIKDNLNHFNPILLRIIQRFSILESLI